MVRFIFFGGPFDGQIGQALDGVSEFWKKEENRQYLYVRVGRRKFSYKRTNEQKRLPPTRK